MRAHASALRARILAAMPGTISDLADRADATAAGVAGHIRALRAQELCHIGGWNTPRKGGPAAIHHAGPGEDVPNPRPRMAEKVAREVGAIPPRDAITAALFGPVTPQSPP